MRQDIRADGVLQQDWETIEDFLTDMSRSGHPGNMMPTNSVTGSTAKWYGTQSYDDALHFARDGWPDGLKRIELMRASLRKVPISAKAERLAGHFAEAGDEVEVGRYLEGEPEHMIEFMPQFVPAAGRIVKLVCNVSASCGVSADSMFRRGAAAVLLADAIEQSGLRAEILIVSAGDNSDGRRPGLDFRVPLKTADQPLEIDRVAFLMCSPSIFRRFMLRAMEQLTPQQFREHAGQCHTLPKNASVAGDDVVLVDAMQWGFGNQLNTDADAVAFVNNILAEYLELEPQPAK